MVLVPDWVAENMRRAEMVDSQMGAALWLDRAVRGQDRRLSVVWVKEGATDPRMVPGRWHVKQDLREQGLPDRYLAITGPRGEYREPDSGVLDELGERSLWRSGNGVEAQIRAREAREAELRYRAAQKRGEKREDMVYAIKAGEESSVSMAPGWRNRAKGRRG